MTVFRSSWYEQRDWGLEYAMQALSYSNNSGDIELFKSIDMEIMSKLYNPQSPLDNNNNGNDNNYTAIPSNDYSKIFNIGNKLLISFDNNTGAIGYLHNIDTNMDYASVNNGNLIGEFIYQSFTESNFQGFIYNYSYDPSASFVVYDFGKVDLDKYCQYCQYQYISSNLANLYENKNNKYNDSDINTGQFIVEWQFNDNNKQSYLHKNYGVPSSMYNIITINSDEMYIDFELRWINKTATRIPETLWFKMNPLNCNDYMVDKLGESVDIGHVLNNGSFHLHSTTGNVTCSILSGNVKVNVEAVDTALVGFIPEGAIELTPFPTPFKNVSENGKNTGFGFILYDNIWGTNYPVWYPFDSTNANHTFRYRMYL